MSIEIWDWGLGYIYLGDVLIAWWGGGSTPRLPSEYQEVEYIETTGTQWIGTWLFASNNIQTEVKIEVSTTNMDKPVFWNVAPSNVPNSHYYHLTCYQNKWYCWLNWSETSWWTYNNTIWTQYTIVYNNSNNMLNVNGSDVVSVNGTVWAWTQLAISYRWWNATYYWQYKYFYFKMYNKTTQQYERDFVPCYRKSDNVIGMYDLVNNQFYTNAWTWTFTKWADVN